MNKQETITKKHLIAQIEKRVEDKILEKSNADLLIKLIEKADSIDEAITIAGMGTIYKRTGLHFDHKAEMMTNDIHYFTKRDDLSFHTDNNKPLNKLIIGDNYYALRNLLIEYQNKVDVIYIDPPYGSNSMGEFAQTNYDNSLSRDNLLSMLYYRLILAKELLADNGVIFCSIDDRNQAYVKCLFDKVFGEKNFIANLNILDNLKGKENDNFISQTCHYVLSYAKNKPTNKEWGFNDILIDDNLESKYNHTDENGKCYATNVFRKTGASKYRKDRPLMYYPILVDKKSMKFGCIKDDEFNQIYVEGEFDDIFVEKLKDKYKKEYYFILPIDTSGNFLRWTSGFYGYKNLINEDMLSFNLSTMNIEQKKYPKTIELIKNSVYGTPKNFVYMEEFANATNALKDIISDDFSNPKSVDLIKYLIELVPSSTIVLDFFAGSGTTGQAVLELNKSDEGNRQFILCQLDEKTNDTPNNIAEDVTAERLKRIMTGEGYKGEKDFKWRENNKPYGGNLDVYEIKTIADFSQTENQTAFDLIDETLYGKEKLNAEDKIRWVCENFSQTRMKIKETKDNN